MLSSSETVKWSPSRLATSGFSHLRFKVVIGEVAVDAVDCQDKSIRQVSKHFLRALLDNSLPQFGKGGLLRAENNMDKDVEVVVANQLHDDLPILVVQDVSKNLILDPAGDLQPWGVYENERSDLRWLPSGPGDDSAEAVPQLDFLDGHAQLQRIEPQSVEIQDRAGADQVGGSLTVRLRMRATSLLSSGVRV